MVGYSVEKENNLLDETVNFSIQKAKKLNNLSYQNLKFAIYPSVVSSSSSQFLNVYNNRNQQNSNHNNDQVSNLVIDKVVAKL